MTEQKLETVTIRGLRYLVVTLREDDIERIAQKVFRLIHDDDIAQADRELEAEHRRQVPTEVIQEAAKAISYEHDGRHGHQCLVCFPVTA